MEYIKRDQQFLESPVYSLADAASYLRVPAPSVRYWAMGRNATPPLLILPARGKPVLSFLNFLECHILHALRTRYELQIRRIRRAIDTLTELTQSSHPLLTATLKTDSVDLFWDTIEGQLINLSNRQAAMKEVLRIYLQRIEWPEAGIPKYYPFVVKDLPGEPKIISIKPTIAFGRSVIDGTGIATSVIAARFNAREPIDALAEEYQIEPEKVQEAIRWEANRTAKAA